MTNKPSISVEEELSERVKRQRLNTLPEYRARQNMLQRCYNPDNISYYNYGARGITICDRWRGEGSFMNFLEDMGFKPTPQHSLDRIDNDGNYEPDNCRWATRSEQVINQRLLGPKNTSGYRGVYFHKGMSKWYAKINVNHKTISLGYYKDIIDAAKAYNIAALKYYGSIAKLNVIPINAIKAEIEK